MSSTGSPEPVAPKRAGWGGIILAAVLVILAILIAIPVLGILYGVLFPPGPPTLESFEVSVHTSPSYGVDDWLYASSDDACRVVRYYQSAGADCRIAPVVCDAGMIQLEQPRPGFNVARCTGTISWSIFQQRYFVNIAAGYDPATPTRIRLEREIFWMGTLPSASE